MPQAVVRNRLIQELDTLPTEYIHEVLHFVGYLRTRPVTVTSANVEKFSPVTMLLSQASLAKDWDTVEEDEAWADL